MGTGYGCGCCNKIMDRGQTSVPTFPMTVVIPHVTCNNLRQIAATKLYQDIRIFVKFCVIKRYKRKRDIMQKIFFNSCLNKGVKL